MDMTFLRDQGLISVTKPLPDTPCQDFYDVELELVMIVNDRNLRYEARWPAGGKSMDKVRSVLLQRSDPGPCRSRTFVLEMCGSVTKRRSWLCCGFAVRCL
jgi:hypothetical protein